MKKNVVIVVLAVVVIALLIVQFMSRPDSNDRGQMALDHVIEEFYAAVENEDRDAYAAMIYGWGEMEEEHQQRVIDRLARYHEEFEGGGGLDRIDFKRANITLEFVFANEGIREHRQPAIFEDGQWKLRP